MKYIQSYQKETAEQRQWRQSGIIILNFEQILHIVPMFPLLLLSK